MLAAKVSLVGPKGAGKSTLTSKFDKNTFSKLLKGAAISNLNVTCRDFNVNLEIWDTCGEDLFRCMGPIFYKATHAAMCVFDMTSKQSFMDLQAWVISVQQYATDECIFVLMGNKKDLSEAREVTEKEALKYAETIGATYFETSGSTGEGVDKVFEYIASSIIHQHDCYNSYHAKLAITSSGLGFCGCTPRRKKNSESTCFSCLTIR